MIKCIICFNIIIKYLVLHEKMYILWFYVAVFLTISPGLKLKFPYW